MGVIEVIAVGFLAGAVSGMFGVGGGVVFVPALVFIFELGQAEAQATSLLAIIPVALIGSWRQNKYGNVDVRDGLAIGFLSLPGAIVAAWIANSIPQKALQTMFVLLAIYIAFRMFRRAFTSPDAESPSPSQG